MAKKYLVLHTKSGRKVEMTEMALQLLRTVNCEYSIIKEIGINEIKKREELLVKRGIENIELPATTDNGSEFVGNDIPNTVCGCRGNCSESDRGIEVDSTGEIVEDTASTSRKKDLRKSDISKQKKRGKK